MPAAVAVGLHQQRHL